MIGAGGVRPAPPGYIEAVAAICKRHGVLLVIDSVICAFGRLGTWLGYERWDIVPDMVVLAKGITSGYLPLGGCSSRSRRGAVLVDAGRADVPPRRDLRRPSGLLRRGHREPRHPGARAADPPRARARGRPDGCDRPLADHPAAGEVRGGLGLAAAIDLSADALEVPGAMGRFGAAIREAGLLVRAQTTGVAIGPPLTIEREQLVEIGARCAPGSTPWPPRARGIYRPDMGPLPPGACHGRCAAHNAPPQAARVDRARQPQGRHARVGALQPRHAGAARVARHRHDGREAGERARPQGAPLPEGPLGGDQQVGAGSRKEESTS